jgi:hypothetical protein
MSDDPFSIGSQTTSIQISSEYRQPQGRGRFGVQQAIGDGGSREEHQEGPRRFQVKKRKL